MNFAKRKRRLLASCDKIANRIPAGRRLRLLLLVVIGWNVGVDIAVAQIYAEANRAPQESRRVFWDEELLRRMTTDVQTPPVIEGGLFQRTLIAGMSERREGVNGLALADLNKDGQVDIVAIYSPTVVAGGSRNDVLRVFLNQGGMRFEPYRLQISGSALTPESFGFGAEIPNLADFNGDGFLDILVTRTRGNLRRIRNPLGNTLLISRGSWDAFEDVSVKAGIRNEEGYNRQSSIGDVDGDGWLDIAIGCDTIGRPDVAGYPLQRLYLFKPQGKNFHDGTFVDIGGTSLIPDFGGPYSKDPNRRRSGPGITLRDLDNDGDLDLVQSYHLDATYSVVGEEEGVHEQKFGVWCWRNLLRETGRFSFEKVVDNGLATEGQLRVNPQSKQVETLRRSLSLPYLSMADTDNDGLLDILLVGPSSPFWHVESDPIVARYWRNRGRFQFEDQTEASGLEVINQEKIAWYKFWEATIPAAIHRPPSIRIEPMTGMPARPFAEVSLYFSDTVFGDFDNNGLVDFVLCNRSEHEALLGLAYNTLFLNQGNGVFKPLTLRASGINTIAIAAETADLNNDGLLDLVFAADPQNSWGPTTGTPPPKEAFESTFYLNTGIAGARQNHWLRLRLSGLRDSELIGARLEARDAGDGSLLGTRILFSNHSYKTGGPLEAHFGLGARTRVRIDVVLASGKKASFPGLEADRFLDLNLKSKRVRTVR